MDKERGYKSKCLLRKKDKIKKYKEIKNVLKSGNKKNYHVFDYFYYKNRKRRIAIVFKKNDCNSIKRNKIKRIVRENVRKSKKEKEKDIVIRFKEKVNKIKYKEIEYYLKKIF